MNELLFPCNPTVGQIFQRWTWNGSQWVTIGRGSGWAPLNSPDFSGMPTAPTPEPGSSDAKLATTAFVMQAIAAATAGVASFNTRTGHVTLTTVDIVNAGGAPINSPHFLGQPEADTAPPGTATRVIATTEFVTDAIADRLTAIVDSFNGRTGDVTLRWDDVQAVGGAPLRDPFFLGIPRAVTPPATDNSTRLATTEYVTRAFAAELHVMSFNQRHGDVVFRASDLSAVGGAFLASPHFTGIPTAPTAPPHTNSDQLATTRYVDAAIASNPGPPGPPGQRGPEGPPGPNGRGMEVVGTVPTVGDLPATGNLVGDIYMVGTPPTYGWFWDGMQWLPLGNIQGAQGPAGAQGPVGPVGPMPTPLGANGALQFNNAGAWGGSTWTFGATGNTLTGPPGSVSALPAASPALAGARATVNDALNLTGVVQPGGTSTIPVFCDGTQWRSGYGTPVGANGSLQFANVPGLGLGFTDASPLLVWDGNQLAVTGAFRERSPDTLTGIVFTSANGGAHTQQYFSPSMIFQWSYSLTQLELISRNSSLVSNPGGFRVDRESGVGGWRARAVATLPTPTSGLQGCVAIVNDGLSRAYDDIVAGGGANIVPVWCDGTNWRIG